MKLGKFISSSSLPTRRCCSWYSGAWPSRRRRSSRGRRRRADVVRGGVVDLLADVADGGGDQELEVDGAGDAVGVVAEGAAVLDAILELIDLRFAIFFDHHQISGGFFWQHNLRSREEVCW
jgi:hypothetical protein